MNILFVDDEPMALRAIRRTLQSLPYEWNLMFSESVENAWTLIDQQNIDVVITDMRMPDVDGSSFLIDLRDRHPETVRLVLSGFRDDDAAIRSTSGAHRFLAKPITSTELVRQIVSTTEGMPDDPHERRMVNGTMHLATTEQVVAELGEVLATPGVSAGEVASIIQTDPALTAKSLQLANSAFFAPTAIVGDLVRCVNAIGLSTLRLLHARNELVHLHPDGSPEAARVEEIRQHAVTAGIERTQRLNADVNSEVEYLGGLLHVAGLLLDGQQILDIDANECACRGGRSLELGVSLLTLWGVPTSIVEATKRVGS